MVLPASEEMNVQIHVLSFDEKHVLSPRKQRKYFIMFHPQKSHAVTRFRFPFIDNRTFSFPFY